MTKQEARDTLMYFIKNDDDLYSGYKSNKDTLKVAIECIEKQIPKKANVNEIGQRWCPHCANNNTRQMVGGWDYCPRCGQKLRGDNE